MPSRFATAPSHVFAASAQLEYLPAGVCGSPHQTRRALANPSLGLQAQPFGYQASSDSCLPDPGLAANHDDMEATAVQP
jgi:hypothetical protein